MFFDLQELEDEKACSSAELKEAKTEERGGWVWGENGGKGEELLDEPGSFPKTNSPA